jgi:glycine cleavage system aminomethyltransferase T
MTPVNSGRGETLRHVRAQFACGIEKGYRAWKGDLSTDYSLLEGGLDRFIRFDKPGLHSARPRWRRKSSAA